MVDDAPNDNMVDDAPSLEIGINEKVGKGGICRPDVSFLQRFFSFNFLSDCKSVQIGLKNEHSFVKENRQSWTKLDSWWLR